jgi:hypothetical protein
MVALDNVADSGQPWASGQTAPQPLVTVVNGKAIAWTGTPLEVELQPADQPQDDGTEDVDIAPQQLQLTPDSIGQDYGTVHIVNQSAEEQAVIVSAQLPETVALYVMQDEPHSATLLVTMDATHELASDADDENDENTPAVHIATASGITTVPVTQSPAPYSANSTSAQSDN